MLNNNRTLYRVIRISQSTRIFIANTTTTFTSDTQSITWVFKFLNNVIYVQKVEYWATYPPWRVACNTETGSENRSL